jgi:hypothetical protein
LFIDHRDDLEGRATRRNVSVGWSLLGFAPLVLVDVDSW